MNNEQHSNEVTTPPSQANQQTKTQKNNRRLIKLLEERYPKAFNWNDPKPLKIGIDKDMQLDEELSASKLKRALAAYTRSHRYKKCLEKHAVRIDLEGQPAGSEHLTPKQPEPKSIKKKPSNTLNKEKKAKNKKPSKNKEMDTNYSKEERMKMKLEQLIANNPKK